MGSSSDGYQQLMALPNGSLAVYGEVALLLAFQVLQVVVFVAMLLTGIWVAYVYKSVWVRNTFTKTVASGQVASVS